MEHLGFCRSPTSVASSSPPAPVAGDPGSRRSSPPVVKVRCEPRVRLGWRGPLPRPRVTPPPCLGDFLPAEVRAPSSSDGVAAGQAGGGRVFQTSQPGPSSASVLGLHAPWAQLRRRFKGVGQLRAGACTLIPPRSTRTVLRSSSSSSAAGDHAASPLVSPCRSYAAVAAATSPCMAAPQPRPGGAAGASAPPDPRAPAPRQHAMAGRRGPQALLAPTQLLVPPVVGGGGPPLFRPILLGAGVVGPTVPAAGAAGVAGHAGAPMPVGAGVPRPPGAGASNAAQKRKKFKQRNRAPAAAVSGQGALAAPPVPVVQIAGQVVPAEVPVVTAAVTDAATPEAEVVPKKVKLWCWKCSARLMR